MNRKNYFEGVDVQLVRLKDQLLRQIAKANDVHGQFKRNMIRDAFATIDCAIESVNMVLDSELK